MNISSAFSSGGAVSIDVKYHLKCLVYNVQRTENIDADCSNVAETGSNPANIEFISLVSDMLNQGEIVSIADLETTYIDIVRGAIPGFNCDRKYVKRLLVEHIPNIDISRPLQLNKPENVALKTVKV